MSTKASRFVQTRSIPLPLNAMTSWPARRIKHPAPRVCFRMCAFFFLNVASKSRGENSRTSSKPPAAIPVALFRVRRVENLKVA